MGSGGATHAQGTPAGALDEYLYRTSQTGFVPEDIPEDAPQSFRGLVRVQIAGPPSPPRLATTPRLPKMELLSREEKDQIIWTWCLRRAEPNGSSDTLELRRTRSDSKDEGRVVLASADDGEDIDWGANDLGGMDSTWYAGPRPAPEPPAPPPKVSSPVSVTSPVAATLKVSPVTDAWSQTIFKLEEL